MKITEYKTAHGSSVKELDVCVNAMLSDGFQPFGSPYLSDREIDETADTLVIWQAMVLYAEQP